jgi:O-antigen/teichoic acid export membrane protein
MSIVLFFVVLQEALILSSYPVLRAQDPSSSKKYTFYVLLIAVIPQLGLFLLYPLFRIFCTSMHQSSSVCSALALFPYLPLLVFRHFLRQLSLCRNDLASIFFLDAFVLLFQLGALLVLVDSNVVNARNVCVVLAGTSLCFVIVWLLRYRNEIRCEIKGLRTYMARCFDFGRWALAGIAFAIMPYYVIPWLLVILHGLAEAAVYAAASTVVGLVSHASAGLTKGLAARTADAYHRGGIEDLNQSVKQACRIVIPILAVIVAAIFVAAQPLSELILPSRADHVAVLVPILGLAAIAGSLNEIVGFGVWAMGRPQTTFVADFVQGVLGVGLGALIGAQVGTAGFAIALLLGNVAGSVVIVTRYQAIRLSRIR